MKKAVVMASVVGLALVQAVSAGLVIGGTVGNGDFENITGGSILHGNGVRVYQNVVGQDLTIPGWTATLTTGGYVSDDLRTDWTNTLGVVGANHSLNMNTWSGTIMTSDTYTEAVSTGDEFTLTYDIASFANETGVLRYNVDLILDKGLAGETTVSLFNGDYAYEGPKQFRTQTFNYTATADYSTVTLEFNGRGTSNANGDMVNRVATTTGIDNVNLSVIPEPATLGMVAVFGGGILFIRRRFMM